MNDPTTRLLKQAIKARMGIEIQKIRERYGAMVQALENDPAAVERDLFGYSGSNAPPALLPTPDRSVQIVPERRPMPIDPMPEGGPGLRIRDFNGRTTIEPYTG